MKAGRTETYLTGESDCEFNEGFCEATNSTKANPNGTRKLNEVRSCSELHMSDLKNLRTKCMSPGYKMFTSSMRRGHNSSIGFRLNKKPSTQTIGRYTMSKLKCNETIQIPAFSPDVTRE